MTAGELAGVLLSVSALITAGLAAVSIIATRRGAKDTTRVVARINEFEIMEGTIKTLRDNLNDAQIKTNQLRADLVEARKETRKLQSEVTTALANVAILSSHIREHVPESVPFPQLQKVWRSNGG